MAVLKDLIVNGVSRFIGKVFINDSRIEKINNSTVGDNPKFTDTTDLGSMTGTLGFAHGGTGKTTGADAANALLNSLSTGISPAQSGDYIIAQYAGGGTSTTTYHRRPLNLIFDAMSSTDVTDALGFTPPSTDTKNTAGSTNTSSKIFLIGATSQAANPQTYSQDTAYVGTDGHLYSDSKQVVNLSGTQALTNKTYNGYTLAAASAKGVDTSISSGSTSTNLPTTAAVVSYVASQVSDTKVTNTLATTTKTYITGTATATTNTGTQNFDTGVYLTTTAGQLNATTYKVNEKVTYQWNATTESLDFIFS